MRSAHFAHDKLKRAKASSPSLAGGSRGFAAQTMYGVVWHVRFAHVPHHTIHQANAAGASKQSGWQSGTFLVAAIFTCYCLEKSVRLLVVEDELDFAQALARGLRQQGYAIDVAHDGTQGWELAEINDYDLLILDLNLPEMDGLEVYRRLRASQPSLLILMLTARDRPKESSSR